MYRKNLFWCNMTSVFIPKNNSIKHNVGLAYYLKTSYYKSHRLCGMQFGLVKQLKGQHGIWWLKLWSITDAVHFFFFRKERKIASHLSFAREGIESFIISKQASNKKTETSSIKQFKYRKKLWKKYVPKEQQTAEKILTLVN